MILEKSRGSDGGQSLLLLMALKNDPLDEVLRPLSMLKMAF